MSHNPAWPAAPTEPAGLDAPFVAAERGVGWRAAAGLGLAYAAAAGLSVLLSRQAGSIATIWFANAIAVALLMRHAPRDWPPALLVVALANLLINLAYGDSLLAAAAFLPANLAEIGLAAWLLRRAGLHRVPLRSPHRLLRLLLLGGVLPQMLAASLGAAIVSVTHATADYRLVWLAWFEGSAIGAVSVLPLACTVTALPSAALKRQLLDPHQAWLLPGAVGVALLSLAHLPSPFVYLGIPLLVAAVLVEFVAVALATLLVSLSIASALALGVFVPPPVTAAWQQIFVYMAYAAALLPAQLLAAAAAELRDNHASLLQRGAELRRVNEALEQFVRIASHDLREPLNTVEQFSSLIEQDHADQLDPQARRYLELMRRAGSRMRALLDDMLQFTRLQRNTGESVELPVALDEVLVQVRHALAGRLMARQAELRIGPLPVVRGHPTLLALLFQNLVANAVKFVPRERLPLVRVDAEQHAGELVVAVRDNGIGIAQADLAKLFTPFTRLNLRREFEGTGLGLALCRQIAQQHGGTVEVSSVPGEGSCFALHLPLRALVSPARTAGQPEAQLDAQPAEGR